jgi:hypothetical protein
MLNAENKETFEEITIYFPIFVLRAAGIETKLSYFPVLKVLLILISFLISHFCYLVLIMNIAEISLICSLTTINQYYRMNTVDLFMV